MDRDGDGIISWPDICEWMCMHIKLGTADWWNLWWSMTGQEFVGEHMTQAQERRLIDWYANQVWAMAREAFTPASQQPNWPVRFPSLHAYLEVLVVLAVTPTYLLFVLVSAFPHPSPVNHHVLLTHLRCTS